MLSGILPFLLTACPKDTHFPGKVKKNETDIAIWKGKDIVDVEGNKIKSLFNGTYTEKGEQKHVDSYYWKASFVLDKTYFGIIETSDGYKVAKIDKEKASISDIYSLPGDEYYINKEENCIITNKCCLDLLSGQITNIAETESENVWFRSKKYTIFSPKNTKEVTAYNNSTGEQVFKINAESRATRWFTAIPPRECCELGDTLYVNGYYYKNGELKKCEKDYHYFGCDNLFYVPNKNGSFDICELDENFEVVSTKYSIKDSSHELSNEAINYCKQWEDVEIMGEEAIVSSCFHDVEIIYLKGNNKFIEIAKPVLPLESEYTSVVTIYEDDEYRVNFYLTRYKFKKNLITRNCLLIKDKATGIETNVKEKRKEIENGTVNLNAVKYTSCYCNLSEAITIFFETASFGVIRTGNIVK